MYAVFDSPVPTTSSVDIYTTTTLACSSFFALPTSSQDALISLATGIASYRARASSESVLSSESAAEGFVDCSTQYNVSAYGKTVYNPYSGEVVPSGTTSFTAEGTETVTLACSAYNAMESAIAASISSQPWYQIQELMNSCFANLSSTWTGNVVYTSTSPSNVTALVTTPCSAYQSSISASESAEAAPLFSFERSPQCTSYAEILKNNASQLGHAVPNNDEVVRLLGGTGEVYTCCGPCRLFAPSVSVLYWSTTPAATGCTNVSITMNEPTANPTSLSGYIGKRAEGSASSYAVVDGSTL